MTCIRFSSSKCTSLIYGVLGEKIKNQINRVYMLHGMNTMRGETE